MSIPLGIVLVLLFIAMQGFFAASEMSLVSQNRLRLHHLAERKDRKAQLILDLLDRPERFLATTLVGQNIALISSSTVANMLCYSIVRRYAEGLPGLERYVPLISTAFVFPLIMVFGQIVPMSISRLNSFRLGRLFITPLRAMSRLLFPLVVSFSRVAGLVARVFGTPSRARNPYVSREELRLLFRGEGHVSPLDKEGRKMIHEIFDLEGTFAEDIMTPLIDIVAVSETSTVGECRELMSASGYTHIPVYRGRVDQITGVVHAHDLIGTEDAGAAIPQYMTTPYIVPETKAVFDILIEFRQNNKNLAFVVDEYGGITGLLSMEDIIEEIVGEISDEHDTLAEQKVSVDKDRAIIDGTLGIDEFNERFGQHLVSGDVETVGGVITATIGRIPSRGERVRIGELEFEIVDATDRKITSIAIKALTVPPGGVTNVG